MRALTIVDHAVLLEETVPHFVARLKPHFVVKGKEFEHQDNVEAKVVASYGGKLLFSSGETQFSSMELLQREYTDTVYSSIRKPINFPDPPRFRHGRIARLARTLRRARG